MRKLIAIGLALAAAAGAWAGLGSVISSFPLNYPGYAVFGEYTEGDYVYFVADNYQSPPNRETRTLKYTRSGSFVGSFPLSYSPTFTSFGPSSCDAAHLGAGYFFVGAGYPWDTTGIFQLTTGSLVQTFYPAVGDFCWDGNYYYNVFMYGDGYIGRATTSGSFDAVYFSGWSMDDPHGIAYAGALNGVSGHYLVCTSGNSYIACYANLDTHSVDGTFNLPIMAGTATYAPGFPSSYGMTLWVEGYPGWVCYQIDLGNSGVVNLTPASLGRIKAVYR